MNVNPPQCNSFQFNTITVNHDNVTHVNITCVNIILSCYLFRCKWFFSVAYNADGFITSIRFATIYHLLIQQLPIFIVILICTWHGLLVLIYRVELDIEDELDLLDNSSYLNSDATYNSTNEIDDDDLMNEMEQLLA